MNKEKLLGQARHWASVVGGVLIGLGYANADDVSQLVNHVEALMGAGLGAIAFFGSWYAREKQDG